MHELKKYKCTIVGSGFSGICLAIKLKRHGIDDFIILEKADEVGGTWRDNHYPGAECDVPSALYSFSFETKTDWDYQWSEQPQILEYIKSTADKNGIMAHIRFASELLSASYDSGQGHWELQLANGATLYSQFLVSAVGQLHKPSCPAVQGYRNLRRPALSFRQLESCCRSSRQVCRRYWQCRQRSTVRAIGGTAGGKIADLPAQRQLGVKEARPALQAVGKKADATIPIWQNVFPA